MKILRFGLVGLAVLALAGVAAFFAFKKSFGEDMDGDSKKAAQEVAEGTLRSWDPDQVISRAHEKLLKVATREQIAKLLEEFKERCGMVQTIGEAKGEAKVFLNLAGFSVTVWAEYKVPFEAELCRGTLSLRLEPKSGVWKTVGYHLNREL